MENKRHYLFEIDNISDGNGTLNVVESFNNIPFEIKRIFYEYGLDNKTVRGNHANRNSRFVMIVVSGSCSINVIDKDNNVTTYHLDKPNKALYLDNMLWKFMTDFSKDCVLLVLSDCLYNKDEYIRDFDDKKIVDKLNGYRDFDDYIGGK